MAVFVSAASGNFTTAGTWSTVDPTWFRDGTSYGQTTTSWAGATALTPGAITADGILLKIAYAATLTGTFGVRLYDSTAAAAVAGSDVTVNVTDLASVGGNLTYAGSIGWLFFKWSAPITLTAAHAYLVQVISSTNASVYVYYNSAASSWSAGLRISGAAAAAPTTGDQVVCVGALTGAGALTSYTITMDQTSSAVKYGTASTTVSSFDVNLGCTLSVPTTAASTWYLNLKAIVHIGLGGTISCGAAGAQIPAGSTCVVNFDATAAGAFYFDVWGTISGQGDPPTPGTAVVGALLTAAHTAGGSTFTIDRATGWKSGNTIAVAGTTRAANKTEGFTLAADATADTLTISGTSANNHDGNATTGIQAEVILTSRNVTFSVTTPATYGSYLRLRFTAVADFDWCAFVGFDYTSGSAVWGLSFDGGTTVHVDYCHFSSTNTSGGYGISEYQGSAFSSNVTFTNNTSRGLLQGLFFASTNTVSSGTITLEDCWALAAGASDNNRLVYFRRCGTRALVMTRCRCAGGRYAEPTVKFDFYGVAGAVLVGRTITMTDCVIHDGSQHLSTANRVHGVYIQGGLFYRARYDIGISNCHLTFASGSVVYDWLVEGCDFYSGGGSDIYDATTTYLDDITFRNCRLGGESGYGCSYGYYLYNGFNQHRIRWENCLFGLSAGGSFVNHTTADFGGSMNTSYPGSYEFTFVACTLGTGTQFHADFVGTSVAGRSFLAFQREGGVLGSHRVYYPRLGTLSRETSVFHTTSPSERMAPVGALSTCRLRSAPKRFDVAQGTIMAPGVWVYLSVAYAGSAPRLIMRANPALGTDDDLVLDTHSGTLGVWEYLSGPMVVAAEDHGQMECYVDCDGSAGYVYVDDWTL